MKSPRLVRNCFSSAPASASKHVRSRNRLGDRLGDRLGIDWARRCILTVHLGAQSIATSRDVFLPPFSIASRSSRLSWPASRPAALCYHAHGVVVVKGLPQRVISMSKVFGKTNFTTLVVWRGVQRTLYSGLYWPLRSTAETCPRKRAQKTFAETSTWNC